jgi:hypothetical protein
MLNTNRLVKQLMCPMFLMIEHIVIVYVRSLAYLHAPLLTDGVIQRLHPPRWHWKELLKIPAFNLDHSLREGTYLFGTSSQATGG